MTLPQLLTALLKHSLSLKLELLLQYVDRILVHYRVILISQLAVRSLFALIANDLAPTLETADQAAFLQRLFLLKMDIPVNETRETEWPAGSNRGGWQTR